MTLFYLSLITMALAIVAGVVKDGPARRCAIALGVVQASALVFGWEARDWIQLLCVDLFGMVIVMLRPAGWLQIVIGAAFLALATKNVAFALSMRSFNAQTVSWQYHITICTGQALFLLGYCGDIGGRCVAGSRRIAAFVRRVMVRGPREADTP